MSATASVLMSAFDEVDYGLIVLDEEFRARFINRAFHRIWNLPLPPAGTTYDFADIVDHGRRTGIYLTPPASVQDYVRQRNGRLRLSDGRILKFKCKALPEGGRLMTFDDISGFVRAAEQLRQLAALDDLTKLPNRRQFLESLEKEFARAQRYDRQLSLLMIDVDHFKQVNDQHGHAVGDEVLRALADRIHGVSRQTDLLGRLGGDEFAVALLQSDKPSALQAAERLCRAVAGEPFEAAGSRLWLTVSVGVAARRPPIDNAAELLRLADQVLYSAKSGGRNQVIADMGPPFRHHEMNEQKSFFGATLEVARNAADEWMSTRPNIELTHTAEVVPSDTGWVVTVFFRTAPKPS
jgi:diguanylate cyclase (GGDEF)-like protein